MPWTKTDTFKIFNNSDKQNEKHPDWTGSFALGGPIIQAVFNQYKKAKAEGKDAKATLRIAFWDAVESSKGNGVKYFNANISVLTEDPEPKPPVVTHDEEIDF